MEITTTDTSACELARQMSALRDIKPRPIARLFGSNGPTPDQHAAWIAAMRVWNAQYRRVSSAQKLALARENAARATR
jgi:hypothetical protein